VAFFILRKLKKDPSQIVDRSDLYCVGYFSKLHGYKGELTATLDTDNVKDYESLKHIFVNVKDQLIPYFVELIEYKTNSTVKVKLEGIDTEDKAKQLVKCSVFIDKKDMSESDDNRVAMRAIVGFKVFDAEKGEIGIVERIEEINNNPLIVIHSGKKEILLPLNEDFIEKIDQTQKELHIVAPGGLIDFYLNEV
jgi:16S rRNA processing protein RimM